MHYEKNPNEYNHDGIKCVGLYFELDGEYRAKRPLWSIPKLQKFNCIVPHFHQDVEFLALTEGDLELVVDGVTYFLSPGDCAVILPYAEHEGFCRIDNETTKYYCGKIDARAFIPGGKSGLGDEIRAFCDCVSDCRVVIGANEPEAREILGILREMKSVIPPDFNCDVRGQTEKIRAAYSLLGVLIRLKSENQRKISRDLEFICACSDRIENDFASELTSRDVASAMGYELTHFCHLFQKNFGRNFSNYLRDFRINASLAYVDSGLTISEIAGKVGFGDYSYFSTEFRKAIGVSPREFFRKNPAGNVKKV